MTKRVKFTATFPDGATLKRSSDRKEYTHAWRVVFKYGPIPDDWSDEHREIYGKNWPVGEVSALDGFASSLDLAQKAASSAFASLSPKRDKNYRRDYRGSARVHEHLTTHVVAVVREG